MSQVTAIHGAASSRERRSSILHQQSPIHSYLFDKQGNLLIANHQARRKWKAKGEGVKKTGGWRVASLCLGALSIESCADTLETFFRSG